MAGPPVAQVGARPCITSSTVADSAPNRRWKVPDRSRRRMWKRHGRKPLRECKTRRRRDRREIVKVGASRTVKLAVHSDRRGAVGRSTVGARPRDTR